MQLLELVQNTDVLPGETLSLLDINGVSYDSRNVRTGDVFVALEGVNANGAAFAIEAERNGASVYIGERNISGLKIPQLLTSNARRTLAFLCANLYGNPQKEIKIIGITGTNGKTSTAFMLKTILAHSGYKTALIGTIKCMIGEEEFVPKLTGKARENFSTMTTPDPDVLYMMLRHMADSGVEILVMETFSHALALEKLAPIEFEIGIFTNLTGEHLDFHGNMENYLLSKAKLFLNCKKGILNMDDPYAEKLIGLVKCNVVGYGIKRKSDYFADNISLRGASGSEYTLKSRNARFRVKTSIPGHFTLYNTLAAATAARELGVNLIGIQNAVCSMNGVCGRLERVKLGYKGNGFSVFIDYAHTPYALENLLKCVNDFRSDGQRIVTLFGCGGERDKRKRAKMGALATQMSDFVIITSDNPRNEDRRGIISDILGGVVDANNYIVIENRKEAIEYAVENAVVGDIILLVGKGHEQYEIDKNGLHPFSEVEIAENAAAKRV